MTGKIFKEYLLWFDGKIAGRNVILLIDGFLAHHAGLNLLQEEFPQGLTNTKVIFLLANAISVVSGMTGYNNSLTKLLKFF